MQESFQDQIDQKENEITNLKTQLQEANQKISNFKPDINAVIFFPFIIIVIILLVVFSL